MDDPRYGINDPSEIPISESNGTKVRVLAGNYSLNLSGPFKTVQPLQMLDIELQPNVDIFDHSIPEELDNCIALVYEGEGKINGEELKKNQVIRLDASDKSVRGCRFSSGSDGMSVMFFAGKRLNQPIAWHGPIVMTTNDELRQTFKELQNGNFPPVRAAWNYRKWSDFPKEKKDEL